MLLGGAPFQPLDDNGAPVPGGKLTFYITGTTTKQDVYHDVDGNTPWSNPVILDDAGRASIFLGDSVAYSILFQDADDAEIWTQDDVIAPTPVL